MDRVEYLRTFINASVVRRLKRASMGLSWHIPKKGPIVSVCHCQKASIALEDFSPDARWNYTTTMGSGEDDAAHAPGTSLLWPKLMRVEQRVHFAKLTWDSSGSDPYAVLSKAWKRSRRLLPHDYTIRQSRQACG